MSEVRTRFAPSPTGFQHIGGFRTAIYSWLLARHFGGKFVLRIEDTDQERRVPGAIRYLLEYFNWFGIDIDEGPSHKELLAVDEPCADLPELGGEYGPYVQSQRLPRYREVAEELIKRGAAYRCDCTAEMLEQERFEQMARKELPGYSGYCRTRNVPADKAHVVRFKMPAKTSLSIEDAVKGRVAWDGVPMRDPVLLKSDSFPTYHLAVVADDHDMKISHILRADEWLSSVPLHVLLYQALDWEPPVFCHLPQVMGNDGKKLSKRHGNVGIDAFKQAGYLPQALLNYVVLVGWSPGAGDEQEVFTREDLFKKFSLDHVNKASAVFDYNKLNWMNGVYIRALPFTDFGKAIEPFMQAANLKIEPKRWEIVGPLVQERARTLAEVPAMIEFLCVEEIKRDLNDMYQKDIDRAKALQILQLGLQRLEALSEFSHQSIEQSLRTLAEELKLKPGPMFGVLRIAVTGKKVTPPLFESFVALGRECCQKRILETVQALQAAL